MPSRRPHTNSHHGCLQCKAKRVKCDQLQPVCSRCQKRGSECTYRHLMSSYNPFQGQPHQQAPAPSSASTSIRMTPAPQPVMSGGVFPSQFTIVTIPPVPAPVPAPIHNDFSSPASLTPPTPTAQPSIVRTANERFLLEHYKTNLTSPNMGPVFESDISIPMTNTILRYLPSHPFLLQVVLCYSAMHLASVAGSSDAQREHLSVALHHKAKALETFRPLIAKGVGPEDGEAVLAASAIFVACALALPIADPDCRSGYNRIDLLAQTAGLFQGNWALFRQGIFGPYVQESDDGPTDYPSPGDDVPWLDADMSITRTIEVIEALEETTESQRRRKSILLHGGSKLRKAAMLVATARKNFHVICMWLGMVKHEFIGLLYERDPLALVLTAHWAICRSKTYSVWWIQGWPVAAVESISEAMDGKYKHLLSWCMEQACPEESGMPLYGQRRLSKLEETQNSPAAALITPKSEPM